MAQAQRIAGWGIGIGILVLALKTAAWATTGGAALFSDAAETVVNVAAAGVALWAVRLSAKPPDATHPYGHDKAEFFAAVIEGALIVVAALVIIDRAWAAYAAPQPFTTPGLGLAINAGSTVINLTWAVVLRWRGRALRSPALLGDARHIVADVVTSVGVLAGVGLAVATGRLWFDPLAAALTAAWILLSGLALVRESVGGLMDEAVTDETLERIRALVATHAQGAIEAHDLRSRHAGRMTFLQFHLVVPGSMSVAEAHEICDRVEQALRDELGEMVISIHLEPEVKAKHQGVLVL